MRQVDTDNCYNVRIGFVSKDALFFPPTACGLDTETCLKFFDIIQSFFQSVAVRTNVTNSVTQLPENSEEVSEKETNKFTGVAKRFVSAFLNTKFKIPNPNMELSNILNFTNSALFSHMTKPQLQPHIP